MNADDDEPTVPYGYVSSAVRELAGDYGVSERTAWRYRKRLAQGLALPAVLRRCDCCGTPLPADASIRRRYCDAKCRVRATRQATKPTGRAAGPRSKPAR